MYSNNMDGYVISVGNAVVQFSSRTSEVFDLFIYTDVPAKSMHIMQGIEGKYGKLFPPRY